MRLIQHAILLLVAALVACPVAAGDQVRDVRHLIYLHGRIVQDQQSARPRHAEYGHYELEAIREAFRNSGFEVTSEIRPRNVTVNDFANRVVEQVRALLASGVRADHVSVVGASMGSAIALRAAARLQNPHVRFVLLSPCLATNIAAVTADEAASPSGHILAIREESDVPTSECPSWTQSSTERLNAREVVIDTGRGHGFLYRPLPEWLDPVVAWSRGK